MDLQQAIHSRRAVRAFADRGVDRRTLRQLIDAAIQAPSAVNEQPWSFTVVQDRAMLRTISVQAKAHVLSLPPSGIASSRLREIAVHPEYDILHGAPALIVISSRSQGPWACEDCALAAENLMLAACAEGLGTCWIGFAQGWLATPEGRAVLGLETDCQPRAPIIVGYPQGPVPATPRNEPDIHWIGSS
jgi:nitroreductase